MSQTTAIKPVIPINNHANKLVRSCYVWVVMAANMLLGECLKIARSKMLTRGLKKTLKIGRSSIIAVRYRRSLAFAL